jgi:hypothetical protein
MVSAGSSNPSNRRPSELKPVRVPDDTRWALRTCDTGMKFMLNCPTANRPGTLTLARSAHFDESCVGSPLSNHVLGRMASHHDAWKQVPQAKMFTWKRLRGYSRKIHHFVAIW